MSGQLEQGTHRMFKASSIYNYGPAKGGAMSDLHYTNSSNYRGRTAGRRHRNALTCSWKRKKMPSSFLFTKSVTTDNHQVLGLLMRRMIRKSLFLANSD
ncbi:MAG: hypothetical protein VYE27_05285 [Pseudomonadota bacterium]|nr:hypothetical protein [Pseudomonadota bacterium]